MADKALAEALRVKDRALGQVEAVVATLNTVDGDGHVLVPGAIPDGTKVTISDFGHSAALPFLAAKPAGKGTLTTSGAKVLLRGQYFLTTVHGREAFEIVREMGPDQQWSFGYDVLREAVPSDEWRAKGARRMLVQLAVKEVSPVLVGAGIGTGTVSTKTAPAAAPAIAPRPIEELLRKSKEITARLAEAGLAPPVAVAPGRKSVDVMHFARFCLQALGAPSGRIAIKFFAGRKPGGWFRPTEPWTVWINNRLDGLDLLEAVGHELVHLERHHRSWPQDEGRVAAEARTLLAAYLEER